MRRVPFLTSLLVLLCHCQGEEQQGEDDVGYELVEASAAQEYAFGVLEPNPEDEEDSVSEAFFEEADDLVAAPASYNAVTVGLVGPVKNQGQCGSCVAFASIAVVEACFKRVTGQQQLYSEQQMVDCAYRYEGASGCNGAPPHSNLAWAANTKTVLAPSSVYPYKGPGSTYVCPSNLKTSTTRGRVKAAYYSYNANEDLLKNLVAQYGVVVTSVTARGPFSLYRRGIFSGCAPGGQTDHAVAVVGYGTDRGVDYWLIKNSWGTGWGEQGYIRLKRGVSMCNVGSFVAVVDCNTATGVRGTADDEADETATETAEEVPQDE